MKKWIVRSKQERRMGRNQEGRQLGEDGLLMKSKDRTVGTDRAGWKKGGGQTLEVLISVSALMWSAVGSWAKLFLSNVQYRYKTVV